MAIAFTPEERKNAIALIERDFHENMEYRIDKIAHLARVEGHACG